MSFLESDAGREHHQRVERRKNRKDLLVMIVICITVFAVVSRIATAFENGFKDDPSYLRYNSELKVKHKGR